MFRLLMISANSEAAMISMPELKYDAGAPDDGI